MNTMTILGHQPFYKTLLIIAAVLTLLFTVMEPVATESLSFWPRLAFWAFHIGVGLCTLGAASWLLRQHLCCQFPRIVNIAISGVLGAIIATPLFVSADYIFSLPPCDKEHWFDFLLDYGLAGEMVFEFTTVFPTFIMVWITINLPLFISKPFLNGPPPEDPKPGASKLSDEQQKLAQLKQEFFDKLPEVIGKELVSISSDLHYLNVTTTKGSALILGSLKTYVPSLSGVGIQTHRSHWVASAQVHKALITGDDAYCVMSNGSKIPISRSKRKVVKDFFGTSTSTESKVLRLVP